jgi:phosphate/sulfate permease
MDGTYLFCNYEAIFPVSIFNTILPALSKMLYTNVVKFPASTSQHITSGTKKL